MFREIISRASTLLATALCGTLVMTCAAHAINTFKTPSASLTTYSLGPGAIKVITPQSGQNVLVMVGSKDTADQGVAYLNIHRVSNTTLVWEGQNCVGSAVSGSSGSPGFLIATVDDDDEINVRVNDSNSFKIVNS